jgi:hypothetical protein
LFIRINKTGFICHKKESVVCFYSKSENRFYKSNSGGMKGKFPWFYVEVPGEEDGLKRKGLGAELDVGLGLGRLSSAH